MKNLDKNLVLLIFFFFLNVCLIFSCREKLTNEIDKISKENFQGMNFWFSPKNIVSKIRSKIPQPLDLQTETLGNEIIIKWTKPSLGEIEHYKLYRTELRGPIQSWKLLEQVIASNKDEYKIEDKLVTPNIIYAYGIVSIDNKGQESDMLESYPVNLKIGYEH